MPVKSSKASPATKPRASDPAVPAAKEIEIEPAQAAHYAELEAAVQQARQNADKIVQMAAQPLVATATSIALGKGLSPDVRVLGIGGTKEKPTLRYMDAPKK